MNVSQGQVVIGLIEHGFGALQNLQRLLGVALLEKQPALQHPHDGGHGLVTQLDGQFPAFDRIGKGLIVLAFHAQAAGLPEVGDRQ